MTLANYNRIKGDKDDNCNENKENDEPNEGGGTADKNNPTRKDYVYTEELRIYMEQQLRQGYEYRVEQPKNTEAPLQKGTTSSRKIEE